MNFFGRGVMATTGSRLTLPTANLIAAYDARAGVTDDGSGLCSAWADQSGNGFNATQTTAGARPAISSTGGLASLLFNGTSHQLFTPAITATTGVKTIYVVSKQTSVPTNYRTIFSPSPQLFGVVPSVGIYGMYDGTARGSGITSTTNLTRLAFETLYAASTARTWVNGVAGTAHAWTGTGAIPLGSIGAFNRGSDFFAGHILALYIYGAARDTAVEAYITQEWGV